MWRTQGGKDVIEMARPSPGPVLARLRRQSAKVIVVVAMFFMVALLVWEATLVPNHPGRSRAIPREMMLGIPGVNPLIPIWYGILGLIVAIVVHEFAHGILTRVGKMAIKALGLVFAIVPMGAFVEPDEDAHATTSKKNRMRVYAVGPATNIIVAFLFVLLFSQAIGDARRRPSAEGPVIIQRGRRFARPNRPDSGYGCQILSIDGVNVTDWIPGRTFTAPADWLSCQRDIY